MLVTAEQLPSVLARLRGEEPPGASSAAEQARPSAVLSPSADSDDQYAGDPVARMTEGYPEVEGDSNEDAWQLTDRE